MNPNNRKRGISMTNEQKQAIQALRETGLSYGVIAKKLQIAEGTGKTFCRRGGIAAEESCCPQCGARLPDTPFFRKRRFCSEHCRMAWWHAHRLVHAYPCAGCGATFLSGSERKYCSHDCYIRARFGRRTEG